MAVATELRTKFTLDGVEAAGGRILTFGERARAALAQIGKAAALADAAIKKVQADQDRLARAGNIVRAQTGPQRAALQQRVTSGAAPQSALAEFDQRRNEQIKDLAQKFAAPPAPNIANLQRFVALDEQFKRIGASLRGIQQRFDAASVQQASQTVARIRDQLQRSGALVVATQQRFTDARKQAEAQAAAAATASAKDAERAAKHLESEEKAAARRSAVERAATYKRARDAIVISFEAISAAANRTGLRIATAFTSAAASVQRLAVAGARSGLTGLLRGAVGAAGLTGRGAAGGAEIAFSLASSSLARAGSALRSVAGTFGGAITTAVETALSPRALARIAKNIAKSVAIVSSPTVAAAGLAHKGATDINDTLNAFVQSPDLGEKTIDQFSRVRQMFQLLGGEANDYDGVLGKLRDALGDFAENADASKFAPIFQMLKDSDINVRNFDGSLKTAGQTLAEVLATSRDSGDGFVSQARLAKVRTALTQLIGPSKELLPFLRTFDSASDPRNLEEITAKIERYGATVGPEQVAAMNVYRDGLQSLKISFQGFANAMTERVGPSLGGFFTSLAELLANRRVDIVGVLGKLVDNSITFASELLIVFTQTAQEFAGYQFKFPWLVTFKQVLGQAWQVAKLVFNWILAIAPSVLGAISQVFTALLPYGAQLADTFQRAGAWVAAFIKSIFAFANGNAVEAGFEWVPKVAQDLADFGRAVRDAIAGIAEFYRKASTDPKVQRTFAIINGEAHKLRDYLFDLGTNVGKWFKGDEVDAGFEWIPKRAKDLSDFGALIGTAAGGIVKLFNVIRGDQQTLSENPTLANLRRQLLDEILPRLKTFVSGLVAFLGAILPPLLSTIDGIFQNIVPRLNSAGDALNNFGKYVVQLTDNFARYLQGAQLDKGFEWIGPTTKNLTAFGGLLVEVAGYIGGLATAITTHLVNPSADIEAKFRWAVSLSDTISAIVKGMTDLKNIIGPIIRAITDLGSAVTLGHFSPEAVGLLAFLLLATSRGRALVGVIAALGRGTIAFARALGLIGGAAILGGGAAAAGGAAAGAAAGVGAEAAVVGGAAAGATAASAAGGAAEAGFLARFKAIGGKVAKFGAIMLAIDVGLDLVTGALSDDPAKWAWSWANRLRDLGAMVGIGSGAVRFPKKGDASAEGGSTTDFSSFSNGVSSPVNLNTNSTVAQETLQAIADVRASTSQAVQEQVDSREVREPTVNATYNFPAIGKQVQGKVSEDTAEALDEVFRTLQQFGAQGAQ